MDDAARLIEDRLEPYGVDVQSTVRVLAAYHRVENTYLSTFQALGGLGLVLGCFGLTAVTARNVLERRREFALLGAGGFTGADLQRLVVLEQMFVVLAGLVVGLAAAIVATVPMLAARGGVPHAGPMMWVATVAVTGLATAMAATRQVRRMPLVASLRGS
jgi:ABC-type antimicrobial peptide transport system permease subunit